MQRLVTYPQLKELFGIPYTPQHILRLQKAGKFPLRRKLGNFNFWLWEDIETWIRELRKSDPQLPDGE
ncbi:MAG: helix-turn-helix transcriptional regulator [Hyphomicrobiaceae bacterium]